MAKVSTNLGKVATTPKGVYSNETTYVKLDIVTYNGSSYVCLKESVGNLPTNTEYWQLIASKGDNGNDGHTPVKGVDYFTQEDIESLNIPSELSELSEDTTHRVVTDVEKETWNNKSDFSGSYNDLTDKPNIPSKTSDLTNDSGFITNSVNNLVNYYLKNEVYTKEEVTQLIGAIQQFHYEVVQELPQTGANNIMYLVPKSTSQTNNVYDEYVYSNGWEKIGDTEIDLSNYVTITMLNQALANYTTTANLTTLLNAKQNEITSTNKLDADLIDDSLSTNKFVTSAEKTNWNGKQDLLMAGDNITISNNVISASGGEIPQNLKVFYNSGNANDVDFIFDENETGIYFFGINTGSPSLVGQRNINFYATNNSKVLMTAIEGIGYLFYTTKYTGEETTKQIYAYLVSIKVDSSSVTFEEKKIEINVDLQKTITATVINNQNLSGSLFVTTNGYQQINAIKVFTMLPQCNLTPTNNNNLTNKKYVDDSISSAIGDINTILATLTTPSNNGGGE